jgi:hypothetical protein
MHQRLYQIPEQVCRNLPDELPDALGIKIIGTDPLRPSPNQATTSGFQFVTDRGKIVLQGIAAGPRNDPEAHREILYVMADCRDPRPLFSDRDLERIESFLVAAGAASYPVGTAGLESAVAQWLVDHHETKPNSEQDAAGQPATRPEPKCSS